MERKENGGWNPYLAGSLSGVLIVASVLATGNYFGASTSFVRTAGMLERILSPERVASMEYFRRILPQVDWQWMFVLGILAGSFLSAVTSRSFRLKGVPDMWAGRFGGGRGLRALSAFGGGVVAMFGARIAGG